MTDKKSLTDLRRVVADNLPTYADCYLGSKIKIPSQHRLLEDADRVIAAAKAAGFLQDVE